MTKQEALEKIKELQEYINRKVNIFDITIYKEVCKELNESEEICPYKKIKQIEKFFNSGWKPNWKNQSEYKYYPYFAISGHGGLVFHGYGYRYSLFFGEVAFYQTNEIAVHVGKNFLKEYNDLKNNY